MHVLTIADVDKPQFGWTSVGQDEQKHNLFMDIYTGLLSVGHGAGHDPTEQDIEYPLLFPMDTGRKAIASWHDPHSRPDEFRAAVTHVAVAGLVDKTDPAIVHVLTARTDLRQVELHPSQTTLFALVLSARVKAQNAEFASLGYQVTVLRRHPPKQTLLPHFEANEHPAVWDGSYSNIGPVLRHGVPQNS